MYGSGREIRLRHGFFPFTEPSLEMGYMVGFRKGRKWLENVLAQVWFDPNVFISTV